MSINLENCLNLRVKIQTSINTSFQGTIYSYNPTAGLITLVLDENSKSVVLDKTRVQNSSSNPQGKAKNYKILKTLFIKNVQIISKKAASKLINNSNVQQPLETISNTNDIKPIDQAQLIRNYTNLEKQYKTDFELNEILQRQVALKNHLGIEIFKKLYKILPSNVVKFETNNDILVFDNILIKYPYLEVKYKDSRRDDEGLDHIKKIVSEAKAKGG